ncbi:MAG: PA0069 family radical SAM protein [Planctomycetota bacterium]
MPELPDALPHAPGHRRGAGLNPANRFESARFFLDGDELDRQHTDGERADPKRISLTVYPDATQTIINRVQKTSDIPFDWTVNPYRGCEHGCIYCFARPYHEYLGFSSGLDFETKLVAKHDAPDLLKRELGKPRWKAEHIVMSAITDVYQPIEANLQLTRRCLEIMAEARQPVSTMTKGALVLRDIDLWQELARHDAGRVTVTIVTLDAQLAKNLEPRAAAPAQRLRVIRKLADAGIPVTVNIAPVIPGLTDVEVPRILEAIADAGATGVAWVLLRLPYQIKALFLDWLQTHVHPDRAKHVESLLRQAHFGKLYHAASKRGRGRGPIAEQIARNFAVFKRRYRLDNAHAPLSNAAFRRPGGQMSFGW